MCCLDVVSTSQNVSTIMKANDCANASWPWDQDIAHTICNTSWPLNTETAEAFQELCVKSKPKEMDGSLLSEDMVWVSLRQLSCVGSNIYWIFCLQCFVLQASFLGGGWMSKESWIQIVLIEEFSLFILAVVWFQTSKLQLKSPISSVIQVGQ